MLKEVTEILDGAIVTERRSTPRVFDDDTPRRTAALEARHGIQPFDLSVKLECELASLHPEGGELDARGAGIQNENRIVGLTHRIDRVRSGVRAVPKAGANVPKGQVTGRQGDLRGVASLRSRPSTRNASGPSKGQPRSTASHSWLAVGAKVREQYRHRALAESR
jgi:hypothetical protein